MNRPPLVRLGLILTLALTLAGCSGAASTATWPGLTANDQLAFVASDQYIYAVNIAGDSYSKEAWKFPTAADNAIGTFSASPAVAPNILVAASDGPASSYSGAVFGLNPQSGQQIWCLALNAKAAQRMASRNCLQAPTTSAAGPFGITLSTDDRVMDRVIITGDTAYFGLNNGMLYAVDAMTGTVKWTFRAQQGVWAAPAADTATNLVYVGSLDHNLYALDLKTGSLKWKKDLKAAIASAPALDNGMLYVGTFGNKVLALDAQSGNEKWSVDTTNWVWGTPVLFDNTLYVSDVGGTVFAINTANGTTLWSVKPGNAQRAGPIVTADAIFVGDRAGKLYALARDTGAPLWPQPQTMKGQLLGTPVLISDTLLLSPYQGDNKLVGYSLAGAQKLAFAPGK